MAKTFDKALIRAELCKAWKSEKMVVDNFVLGVAAGNKFAELF